MNPFSNFAPPIRPATPLRAAITAAYRRPEPECVPPLIEAARQSPEARRAIAATARKLVEQLRANPPKGLVQNLVQEYALNSQEGVALMCLAEALLRIPDDATRDALIRDKISGGDWAAHLGLGQSLFVNAATWGLVVTGKLTSTVNEVGLTTALTRLVARVGEPVIRAGVDMAMRLMGEQFVTGQTIDEALANGAKRHGKGYRFSYDMLGEAATTADDAERYYASYEAAIHAIGKSAGEGPYAGDGISIKLSALHPRYTRAQAARVMAELLPRVAKLAIIARFYNIGFNVDAEEADRLELSLDLLESLCFDAALSNWNGLGFVVQAYGKRCPFVLDFIIELARRSKRRVMVRLVKGAYWDSEIKRAQVDGLEGFPVYTRKIYTDVSYIACAKKLLAARDAVFPQFATHNAQSLATIYRMAGPEFRFGDYEFQCLHGMGEPLYDQVVGATGLGRPCRIYAPVGTHETLLAYLVRRLLENGANSSFVNRIADEDVPIDELLVDPVDAASRITPLGAPHDKIASPSTIYGARSNSKGIDLANEHALVDLAKSLQASAGKRWAAEPLLASNAKAAKPRAVFNPANNKDQVGTVAEAKPADVMAAAKVAASAYATWTARPASERAAMMEKAAHLLEAQMMELMGLIMREAGKSAANAIAEVREAVDFLRYYASEARDNLSGKQGLGVITCISPWNFPLAIFLGQVSAALVAGNAVLAKPAEETPLIAFEAVKILHKAGVPKDVLLFLPGDGSIGEALVAAPETQGVMFTGSTEVARLINATLSKRLSHEGRPISLIAETGGQNAMIVDSSALAEQVVGDVLASAFDSAGQRCSALRVLCLQEDVADRTLTMLKGAMQELRVGNTITLAADVGPIITAEAQGNIERHISAMADKDHPVTRVEMSEETGQGSFVAPTLIEISSMSELQREVFGPVLHVLRFARDDMDKLVGEINATGYGLTFGLHTRLDETIVDVTSRIHAGNLYVNRNTIGAVVGVQPFGGHGLSGTGPKAGGPLYLHRLVRGTAPMPSQREVELQGPVGERNLYKLTPRGRVLCLPQTAKGLEEQLRMIKEAGNEAVVSASPQLKVPEALRLNAPWQTSGPYAAALIEAEGEALRSVLEALAALPGSVILAQNAPYDAAWLMAEISTSINTTAAGGNANLMAIG